MPLTGPSLGIESSVLAENVLDEGALTESNRQLYYIVNLQSGDCVRQCPDVDGSDVVTTSAKDAQGIQVGCQL